MSSSKKPVDSGKGWYAKMRAWKKGQPDWIRQLTPAEKQQFDDEANWSSRARREDLPGPTRIYVFDDY